MLAPNLGRAGDHPAVVVIGQPGLHSLLFTAKGCFAAAVQKGLSAKFAKDFDQTRHQSGPPGLMAGADTGAVVAVEILVEQQAVAPKAYCVVPGLALSSCNPAFTA
jgi:hypothetical protein